MQVLSYSLFNLKMNVKKFQRSWVNELFTGVCGPLCVILICLNQMFQKRNRAFPSTLETWILCETGYESHPYRPANDLHTSPHVYGHLHEKVRTEVPVIWQCNPQNTQTCPVSGYKHPATHTGHRCHFARIHKSLLARMLVDCMLGKLHLTEILCIYASLF